MSGRSSVAAVPLLLVLLAGCAARTPYDRDHVSASLSERTGQPLGPAATAGETALPPEVRLDDGLDLDEAVATALWNNAQFQADLAELGLARADLHRAGLISNPVFSLLFPVGPKGLETKLLLPVGELLQRPWRVAAAEREAGRIAENLVGHGLALVREVQTTFTGLEGARHGMELAREEARLRIELADITRARLAAGDISEQEAAPALLEALAARDALSRSRAEAARLEQVLTDLLGLGERDPHLMLQPTAPPGALTTPPEELVATALEARPDLRAAELAVEAAGKRAGLESSRILEVIGIIDAKDKGEPNLTTGPGLQLSLPLFNLNGPGRERARAEIEQAGWIYLAVRHRIGLEVRTACADYQAAFDRDRLAREGTLAELEASLDRTRAAYQSGDLPYADLLRARAALISGQIEATGLAARLDEAAARLDFSMGIRTVPRTGTAPAEEGANR